MNTLINVALGKSAFQSSLSPWSSPGEASRAVSGVLPIDYAFHTDFEHKPWWQVDLGDVFYIESIIIHNRILHCRERARRLMIEIAEAPDAWFLVHAGFANFGAGPTDNPLKLSIGGELRARFIRLSLECEGYLHLSCVEVFSQLSTIYFNMFCKRYKLDRLYLGRHESGRRYILESPEEGDANQLVGLKLAESGRFGNILIQYTNMIAIARYCSLKYIILGENDILRINTELKINDIMFLTSNSDLPSSGFILAGTFFNSSDFFPILKDRMICYSEDEVFEQNIIQQYIRPYLLDLHSEIASDVRYENELTIHLRAGDIFQGEVVHRDYRQPPLSFYLLAIVAAKSSGLIECVRLVFEDRGNPCIDALEDWLQSEGIPFRITSRSLREDVAALMNAQHLVVACGSMGHAICRLSQTISTVFYFEPEHFGVFGAMPETKRVFAIADNDDNYIKPARGDHLEIPGEWKNSVEQRELMLSYPEKSLQLRCIKNV